MAKGNLKLEIIEVENGFVVFEGLSFGGPQQLERKKWVAWDIDDLGSLVIRLGNEENIRALNAKTKETK